MMHRNPAAMSPQTPTSFGARSRSRSKVAAVVVKEQGFSRPDANRSTQQAGHSAAKVVEEQEDNVVSQSPFYDGSKSRPPTRSVSARRLPINDVSPPLFVRSRATAGSPDRSRSTPQRYSTIPGSYSSVTPSNKKQSSDAGQSEEGTPAQNYRPPRIIPELLAPTPSPVPVPRLTSTLHPATLEEQYLEQRKQQQEEEEVLTTYAQRYQLNSLELRCDTLTSLSEKQSVELADVKEENAMLRAQMKILSRRHEHVLTDLETLQASATTLDAHVKHLGKQLVSSQQENQQLLLQCNTAATSMSLRNDALDQLSSRFRAQTINHQFEVGALEERLHLLFEERDQLLKTVIRPTVEIQTHIVGSATRCSQLAIEELDRLEMSTLTAERVHQQQLEQIQQEKLRLQEKMDVVASQCERLATAFHTSSMERAKSRTPQTTNS